MWTSARRLIAWIFVLTLILGATAEAQPAQPPADPQAGNIGRTPPRLSYVDGEASFWRPGAQDWVPAQLNTPLAPGDELYTGNRGNLELQIGGRAFVRTWGDTQIGLLNQEPDFLQFKVTTGHVGLDLRTVEPGRTVEVDTPHGAFVIERPGYYRVDVTQNGSTFITRRAGQATMTSAGGQPMAIAPSEEVVLEGSPTPTVQSYVAPDLDAWDRWNYARTDHLLDSVSARYVASGVYGVDELDHYGNWRVLPSYGSVWVPEGVPAGWAPYSTGRWIADPYYGWTWVDAAPWGWAPYHHGRWVFVDSFWAWAPGPVVVRPVYAPALVAFFGAPGVRVAVGAPFVSWVALSWGEPVVPWWGRAGFVGRPAWLGWGGPRVVNNVVVNRTTVVNVNNITVYRNMGAQNAVVAVHEDQFGRRPVQEARIAHVDTQRLEPIRGALGVKPDAQSFVPATGRATRPPEAAISRPVVATRPPAHRSVTLPAASDQGASAVQTPAPRIVSTPRPASVAPVPPRPTFGVGRGERERPEQPQRFEPAPRPEQAPRAEPPARRESVAPRPESPARPESRAPRPEAPARPESPAARPESRAPRPEAPARPEQPARPEHPAARPEQPAVRPERPAVVPQALPPVDRRATERRGVEPPGRERRAMEPPAAPRGGPPTMENRGGTVGPGGSAQPLPGVPANRLSPGRSEQQQRPQAPEGQQERRQ
jgi:hypothetical protein